MTETRLWASRGALVGAGAALLVAFGDYGASWLFVPYARDRGELFLRLLGTEVPVGALLGALVGLIAALSLGPMGRLRVLLGQPPGRLRTLPFALFGAPPAFLVAHLLLSGARASQVPMRDFLVVLVGVALVGVAAVSLELSLRLLAWAAPSRPRGFLLGAGAFFAHLLLSKSDQVLFPKLYEYLHATLSVASFAMASLTVAALAMASPRARVFDRERPQAGLAFLGAALLVLLLDLGTLEHNQNVRVALFDPRAATSRSLMQGIDPLLPNNTASAATSASIEKARAARAARRRASLHTDGLPVGTDAHVLLITVDALRADHLGLYGYDRPVSPFLDRFAKESVVFERAYTAAPHSSYSLCSVMTSEHLHETVDLGLPLPAPTLARSFTDAGLGTAAFYTLGIFHTEGERLARYQDDAFGFARHDHSDLLAEKKTDLALAEIDSIADRGEPPSFLWVHYFDTHEPYRHTELGTSELDRYDSEIKYVDREVGRLIVEAKKRLHRDIVIVLSADHGEEFRDHGGVYHGSTLYDEQVRVPLIVNAPFVPPKRIEAPVSLVHLAPTLLGLLGLPVPSTMRGEDLRPLMAERAEDAGPVFAGVMHKRMVVRWPYKLIADLRFNLYELYDLTADPRERKNLADQEPTLVDSLRGEIYAWLDALREGEPGARSDPRQLAIDRGHLGDRRAVVPLAKLVADESAPEELRVEAGRILGKLADRDAAPDLVRALEAENIRVAAEAAIALGRMVDKRGLPYLRRLVHSEDPDIRARASVSLGRLGDPAAVPGLIEALWVVNDSYERQEAVRWLGRLRDPRAVGPLIELLPEFRFRRLASLALGHIGDPRALPALVSVLDYEHRPNIRDGVSRALGQLGDPRALERLTHMAVTEPDLTYVGESLVRLHATEGGIIGGTDVGPSTVGRWGFGSCHAGPTHDDWDYLGRTYCETLGASASLRVVPPAEEDRARGAVMLLRLRRVDEGSGDAEVTVRLGDAEVAVVSANPEWKEARVPVDAAHLASRRAHLEAGDPSIRLAVDHLLLVPRPTSLAVFSRPTE